MSTLRNKRLFLGALLAGAAMTVQAQQNPTLDNYLFNPVSISPAAAGQQSGDFQSLYDAQWIGLQGAPRTGAVYYDYMSPKKFGFNLGLMDDQVGPMRTQNMGISTAYHLQVGRHVFFATGVKYTFGQTRVDITDEFYVDKVDAAIYDLQGPWIHNVDLSGTLYTRDWYFGLTMKNMAQQEVYRNNFTARMTHLYGARRFKLNQNWTVNPSFLVTVTQNSPLDINIHSFFEFRETIGYGINFSPGDEVGMFFKTDLNNGWNMFYQYNLPITDLIYTSFQSHVLGVGINVSSINRKVISPRYFL